jgi:hypothetical protein
MSQPNEPLAKMAPSKRLPFLPYNIHKPTSGKKDFKYSTVVFFCSTKFLFSLLFIILTSAIHAQDFKSIFEQLASEGQTEFTFMGVDFECTPEDAEATKTVPLNRTVSIEAIQLDSSTPLSDLIPFKNQILGLNPQPELLLKKLEIALNSKGDYSLTLFSNLEWDNGNQIELSLDKLTLDEAGTLTSFIPFSKEILKIQPQPMITLQGIEVSINSDKEFSVKLNSDLTKNNGDDLEFSYEGNAVLFKRISSTIIAKGKKIDSLSMEITGSSTLGGETFDLIGTYKRSLNATPNIESQITLEKEKLDLNLVGLEDLKVASVFDDNGKLKSVEGEGVLILNKEKIAVVKTQNCGADLNILNCTFSGKTQPFKFGDIIKILGGTVDLNVASKSFKLDVDDQDIFGIVKLKDINLSASLDDKDIGLSGFLYIDNQRIGFVEGTKNQLQGEFQGIEIAGASTVGGNVTLSKNEVNLTARLPKVPCLDLGGASATINKSTTNLNLNYDTPKVQGSDCFAEYGTAAVQAAQSTLKLGKEGGGAIISFGESAASKAFNTGKATYRAIEKGTTKAIKTAICWFGSCSDDDDEEEEEEKPKEEEAVYFFHNPYPTLFEKVGDDLYQLKRTAKGMVVSKYDTRMNMWEVVSDDSKIFSGANRGHAPHKYSSTIQSIVIDSDIYLLGRAYYGVKTYKFNTNTYQWDIVVDASQKYPTMFIENHGWNKPSRYMTIQSCEINGDIYVLGRGNSGVYLHKLKKGTTQWEEQDKLNHLGDWNDPPYYTTIQHTVINNKIYLVGRGNEKIYTYEFSPASNTWRTISQKKLGWDRGNRNDEEDWNKPEYFSTIQLESVGHHLYLIGRGSEGIETYKLDTKKPNGWIMVSRQNPGWRDDKGWNKERYFATIKLEKNNNRLYLFARNHKGIETWKLNHRWEGIDELKPIGKPIGAIAWKPDYNQWKKIETPHFPRWSNDAGWNKPLLYQSIKSVSIGDNIYLIGINSKVDKWRFNTTSEKWIWEKDVADFYLTDNFLPKNNGLLLTDRTIEDFDLEYKKFMVSKIVEHLVNEKPEDSYGIAKDIGILDKVKSMNQVLTDLRPSNKSSRISDAKYFGLDNLAEEIGKIPPPPLFSLDIFWIDVRSFLRAAMQKDLISLIENKPVKFYCNAMILPQNWGVKVFKETNFKGESLFIRGAWSSQDAKNWKDQIRSIKVYPYFSNHDRLHGDFTGGDGTRASFDNNSPYRFGDFDGDGATDLFVSENQKWKYNSLNKGELIETGRASRKHISQLGFGDFDGDGKTDALTITNGVWSIRYGAVSGWQTLNTSDVSISASLPDLRFGDFDGDGKTDVFVSHNQKWLIRYGGKGKWVDTGRTSGKSISQLRFGDFNGDGKTDIYILQGKTASIRYGATSGWQTFDEFDQSVSVENLRFGDFDGDGKTDIFTSRNQELYIKYGGVGEWEFTGRKSAKPISAFRFGDFNGDGKTDVLLINDNVLIGINSKVDKWQFNTTTETWTWEKDVADLFLVNLFSPNTNGLFLADRDVEDFDWEYKKFLVSKIVEHLVNNEPEDSYGIAKDIGILDKVKSMNQVITYLRPSNKSSRILDAKSFGLDNLAEEIGKIPSSPFGSFLIDVRSFLRAAMQKDLISLIENKQVKFYCNAMILPQNWGVKVFKETNFKGESLFIRGAWSSQDASNWKDQIRSIKVYKYFSNHDRLHGDFTGGDGTRSTYNDTLPYRFGDFDGDGATDLFVSENNAWKYFSVEKGKWIDTKRTSGKNLSNIRFGDFNGDGKTDALTITNGVWSIRYGAVSGWQTLNTSDASISASLPDLRFGDFDGDGKTDVFVSHNQKWLIRYGGKGKWVNTGRTSGKSISQLRFGDFNGDGKTDIYILQGKTASIRYGATSGWQTFDEFDQSVSVENLRFGDFDGDGKTDIFTSRDKKWLIKYGGKGEWVKTQNSGYSISNFRFGDINGDGKTDVYLLQKKPYKVSYSASSPWEKISEEIYDLEFKI